MPPSRSSRVLLTLVALVALAAVIVSWRAGAIRAAIVTAIGAVILGMLAWQRLAPRASKADV